MKFHKTIFRFAFLLFVQNGFAQGSASIKASVDKNKILIGEPVELTLEAFLPPSAVIGFVSIDTIAHFEFVEKPAIDTIKKNGGIAIRGVYKITSFDSGHWVIPSFTISKGVRTDTIPVDVVFSDFDPSQDYHDIKDILDVHPARKKENWWWYVGGGVLLLALLLLYVLRKKKPARVPVPEVVSNPYEEAIKELEKLQKEKPEAKQYYPRLTDIFRLYIFRKRGILSLQKTTDDLILQMQTLNLSKGQLDKLAQSLRLADFVKFAKYIPTSDDDKTSFEEIKKSITTLEQSES